MTEVNNTIMKMLRKRGHSNPQKGIKNIVVTKLAKEPVDVIYKNRDLLNFLAYMVSPGYDNPLIDEANRLIGGEDQLLHTDIILKRFGSLEGYKSWLDSSLQKLSNAIRSGQRGSIKAFKDWFYDTWYVPFVDTPHNFGLDDVFPNFEEEIKEALEEAGIETGIWLDYDKL